MHTDTGNAQPPAGESASRATPCPNCGDATGGNYCPNCGQRRGTRVASLRRLIGEAIEDQLSLNAALPRTVALLVRRPGRLTAEYLRGRIARFIPPFRLYLITSFLFFLAFSTLGSDASFTLNTEENRKAPITVNTEGLEVEDIPFLTQGMNERLRQRVEQMRGMPGEDIGRSLQREILARAPIGIFLLLPFLAAVLKLLHVRSGRFYVEHFVFAVHLQTFAFMIFTALVLLDPIPVVPMLLMVWLPVYTVLAMKEVYAQSWAKTMAKFVVLSGVYTLGLGIAMLVILLIAFMFMPI